jgi:hypothetical protein
MFEPIAAAGSLITGCATMDWFPDGQRIVLTGLKDGEVYSGVCVLDRVTGKIHELTSGPYQESAPHVSVRMADLPASVE